jgi:hypothetical protein
MEESSDVGRDPVALRDRRFRIVRPLRLVIGEFGHTVNTLRAGLSSGKMLR